ncbi:MAG: coproporphyrinogen III oxidase [Proteobacteria bacterium]|nr:MAG: coproporphyrinogen III oxidase [Pseudomonadota bacterium]
MASFYEIGPIRPPSEATSLLVRVSRNCPWNRCTFCPVYKCQRFELRPLDDVLADVRAMARVADRVRTLADERFGGRVDVSTVRHLAFSDPGALQLAVFLAEGGQSAFLQDADSLVVPPETLSRILEELRARFPTLTRVTSYARARTLVRRRVEDLRRLREAGLNRIHVGLETGSNVVLRLVDKGVTSEQQIEAGRRVKAAEMELSFYVMPGLGGRAHSEEHARETARVLRAVDPHVIRLRSLAIPPGSPLDQARERGAFEPLREMDVVAELRQLLAALEGMSGRLTSDHVLNLFGELEGQLPDDHAALLALLDTFLELDEERQQLFVVGRRLGLLHHPMELANEAVIARVRQAKDRLAEAFDGDLDRGIEQLRLRFI